ncbi:hypothetical protein GCM10023195_42310 [Actinoallomurus liliacearum]|uniref:Big-1 domain-containing protein n=1 Tax=Actinoallomurus liliacearum TaxID=1080073 RepID=A0ABP8TKA9_9ACTN
MRPSLWIPRLLVTATLICSGVVAAHATAGASPGPGPRPVGATRAAQQKAQVLRRARMLPKRTADAIPAGGLGNGIFQVYVTPAYSVGTGQFTVMTGPNNPAGAGRDVLFGGGAPGTSYMIVRDVTTGVDYVQGQMLTHANEVSLDDLNTGQWTEGTTTTTAWSTTNLEVHQEVSVAGTTVANSRVSVTTKITDYNTPPHRYRIQYLWDTELGTDDGPVIQPHTAGVPYAPFDPVVGAERTITRGTDDTIVVDNDTNPGPPTLAVALSGADNAQAVPESVKYLCWADAIFAPLGGYVTDATRDISDYRSDCLGAQGDADSAVEYLWSADASQGDPQVTASLRMSPPAAYATTMKAGPISLGSATATLTDTATGRPIAGRAVSFSVGGRTSCDTVTDAAGHATCGGLLGGLLGYDVRYAGDAIWASSTAHGGLLLKTARRNP